MKLRHYATLMAFLISLIAGCSTQYPHEPLSPLRFGALFLIGFVLAIWLLLILRNTKSDTPKPRDGCSYYWLGIGHGKRDGEHIHIIRGTVDRVAGWVNRRPLNGDILLREDAEGQEHCYVMTNVKWDDQDGMKFTANITPMEEE